MTTPNTDTPGTTGNTPHRIPPRTRITRYKVVTIALPHDYKAVEILKWMQEPHTHLVYALPQRRTVRKWVDEKKRRD